MFIFGLVSAGLVLAGLVMAALTWNFLRGAKDAEGKLLDYSLSSDSEGNNTRHRPTVEFTTASGQVVEFTSRVAAGRKWQEGDAVPVKYDPNRPERARVATARYLWQNPVLYGGVGLATGASDLFFF